MKSKLTVSALVCLTILGLVLSYFLFMKKGETKVENNNAEKVQSFPGYQLENPKENEEIAVMKTNLGEIKIRLFPEKAPKAVENFKTLASNGYYNNLIFHRVIKDFMIQSGDPTGTGTGGESKWKKSFEDEFSKDLLNVTGALSMANRGKDTNGSQFFINFQDPKNFKGWEVFESNYEIYKKNPKAFKSRYGKTIDMSKVTEEVKNLYSQKGGNPFLDGYYSTSGEGHTVFGQVFEGLDVVEKISNSETDENDKPKTEIKIEKVEINEYKSKG